MQNTYEIKKEEIFYNKDKDSELKNLMFNESEFRENTFKNDNYKNNFISSNNSIDNNDYVEQDSKINNNIKNEIDHLDEEIKVLQNKLKFMIKTNKN